MNAMLSMLCDATSDIENTHGKITRQKRDATYSHRSAVSSHTALTLLSGLTRGTNRASGSDVTRGSWEEVVVTRGTLGTLIARRSIETVRAWQATPAPRAVEIVS